MWSIIKDLIFSHTKNKIITKKMLISKTISILNDNRFDPERYAENYYNEQIQFLIESVSNSILVDISTRTLEQGKNYQVYEKYYNNVFPVLNKFVVDNLKTENYRRSFLLTIIPDEKIDFDQMNTLRILNRNFISIKYIMLILSKLIYAGIIKDYDGLKEHVQIDESSWKLRQIDSRGLGIIIAGKIEDIDEYDIGGIVNKFLENKILADVWYFKHHMEFGCEKILPYSIDITKPEIWSGQKVNVSNPQNVFRIECMKCIKEKTFDDYSECENLFSKECVKWLKE
jgi:hypothetical protein